MQSEVIASPGLSLSVNPPAVVEVVAPRVRNGKQPAIEEDEGGAASSRRTSCDACIRAKTGCALERPCARCVGRGEECVDDWSRPGSRAASPSTTGGDGIKLKHSTGMLG